MNALSFLHLLHFSGYQRLSALLHGCCIPRRGLSDSGRLAEHRPSIQTSNLFTAGGTSEYVKNTMINCIPFKYIKHNRHDPTRSESSIGFWLPRWHFEIQSGCRLHGRLSMPCVSLTTSGSAGWLSAFQVDGFKCLLMIVRNWIERLFTFYFDYSRLRIKTTLIYVQSCLIRNAPVYWEHRIEQCVSVGSLQQF